MPALLHQLIGSTSLFGALELQTTLAQMSAILGSNEKDKMGEVDYTGLQPLLLLAQQQLKAYQAKD
jgi:hypothetical protein